MGLLTILLQQMLGFILQGVIYFESLYCYPQILQYGNSVRSKGASGVNPDSSRSHAILQLDIRNSEDVKVGK